MIRLLVEQVDAEALLRVAGIVRRLEPVPGESQSASQGRDACEDLVEEPFGRLIESGELIAYPYDGFWEPMDTIKDKQKLDALFDGGRAPWLEHTQRSE